jgi:hypothetical protein
MSALILKRHGVCVFSYGTDGESYRGLPPFCRSPLNIDALLQKPGYDRSALPFVSTLEACRDSLLRPALEKMSALDFTARPCLCLPVPG